MKLFKVPSDLQTVDAILAGIQTVMADVRQVQGFHAESSVLPSAVIQDTSHTRWWDPFVDLFRDLRGYGTVIILVWLLLKYIERRKIVVNGSGLGWRLLRLFLHGNFSSTESCPESSKSFLNGEAHTLQSAQLHSSLHRHVILIAYFVWLQISYLGWGFLQEKIMTTTYESASGNAERFRDSQFLVLANRLSAFFLACAYILSCYSQQPVHRAPLYAYGYASFSNIMSAWFQYEALKFISFPMQVLGKAFKPIPVMIMGRCVRKKTYPPNEYLTAFLISAGVFIFLLAAPENKARYSNMTTFSGFLLMIGYLVSDSFTSNWQGQLFKVYRMSSWQMMAGVNFCSVLLLLVSEVEQGSLPESIAFASKHQRFALDVFALSLCSAVGQVAIFKTIADFGPVTFTIMMTIRQCIAVFLSSWYYEHQVGIFGILGIIVTFLALFLRIYLSRIKK